MFCRRHLAVFLTLAAYGLAAPGYLPARPGADNVASAGDQTTSGIPTSMTAKSTHFLFSGLRSGVIKAKDGWNAQDFAVHIMNPNPAEIPVTWKLISDDPRFVFRDGSVGTWTTTQTIPSLGAGSFNVYGPRIYQIMDSKVVHFPVPALTNFTGSVEFSGSSPFYVFSGKPFETGQATDSDPDRAWYKAWDAWSNEIPAIWDDGLQAFVIPYTNYWHNVKEWAVGWHSTLRIENNSEQTVTYSVKHNPDTYGEISNPALACQATHYQAQTVAITLDQGKELSTPLEILYGWPADHASFMEGILLIQPDPVTAWKETLVASTVVPNGSGSGMCSSGAPLAAVLITSPIPTVSGTVSFSAATFLGRGYMTDKVEYYIDGKLKSTTRTGPDSFEWNTVSTPNGLHTLMVIAFGTEGGTASQSVTVRVSNPPAR